MTELFSESHRCLQRQFDSERLADRIEERLVHDHIREQDRAFIEGLDMVFLATADRNGHQNCSYKGGDPGFVRVTGPKELAMPLWNGNGMFLSAGNVLENPEVGMLFIDFQSPNRMRVNGTAVIEPVRASDPWRGAQLVMRMAVREVFPNCGRYIHRMELVERSRFVPRDGVEPPVPGWKRSDWAKDVLPKGDPARES